MSTIPLKMMLYAVHLPAVVCKMSVELSGWTPFITKLKNTLALADRVVPSQVADRIEERVSVIPSATPMIHGAFDFAGKLLAAQRDFAGEMIEIFQPAPAKPAAPKAAAKKAPAKRTARKAA